MAVPPVDDAELDWRFGYHRTPFPDDAPMALLPVDDAELDWRFGYHRTPFPDDPTEMAVDGP